MIIHSAEGPRISLKDLESSFIKLAKQNNKLKNDNEKLKHKLELTNQKLQRRKKELKEKTIRKEDHVNQVHLPKREPITPKIYQLLIKEARHSGYKWVRLRVALCLLMITGAPIIRLRALRVVNITEFLRLSAIPLDPSRYRDYSLARNYEERQYLTHEVKKLIKERKKDFEFLLKERTDASYLFTPEYKYGRSISRETLTREVNQIMRSVSKNLPNQPYITGYSFRIGFSFLYLTDWGSLSEQEKQEYMTLLN